MKGFAKGIIHSLALIAILAMQPIGQQYCTANDALCPSSGYGSHMDCCDRNSEKKESPCCVEVFSKLPFVPGNAGSVLPDPIAFEFPTPEPFVLFEGFRWDGLGSNRIADIDSPPRTTCSLAHFCVRLV